MFHVSSRTRLGPLLDRVMKEYFVLPKILLARKSKPIPSLHEGNTNLDPYSEGVVWAPPVMRKLSDRPVVGSISYSALDLQILSPVGMKLI